MKILYFLLILVLINQFNFAFLQTSSTQTPSLQMGIRMFYDILRPAADVGCLQGNTALEKITNCINTIAKTLRYLAVILFVIGLTYVAGLMIIAPFKTDSIKQAKTILIWIIVGFIILFIIEKITQLIHQIAGK